MNYHNTKLYFLQLKKLQCIIAILFNKDSNFKSLRLIIAITIWQILYGTTLLAKPSPKPTEEIYPNKIRTIDKIILDNNKESTNLSHLCTFTTDAGTKFIWNTKANTLESSIMQRNSSLSISYKLNHDNFIYIDYAREVANQPNLTHRNVVKIEFINNILYETQNMGLNAQSTNKIIDFNKMKWYKDSISYNIKCIEED